ncbi:MAG: universal stress protein [Crocinitomicaceae bacterium]
MENKIKRILIPIDYSPNATQAAIFGFGLAEQLGAEVLLFHAYHFPLTTSEDMVYVAEMKDGEDEKLEKEREKFQQRFKKVKMSSLVEYGSAVDLIASLSERKDIDLIVMGTKGETSALDAVLGSVASNTINSVNCPLLIIPEETKEFKLEEILFATDYHSTPSREVYAPLFQLLDKSGASIDIVNVKPEIELEDMPSREEIRTKNMFKDYKFSHHFIEAENVEEALFDFAVTNHCDLMVILTKHYSLWQRIWHTSLAKKLSLHSTIPLLILHEKS